MFRLCVLGVLVSALAVAAPVPKLKGKKLYSPVRVGDTKVMETKCASQTWEWSETVSKVLVDDGVYTVTVDREEAGMPPGLEKVYEVSEKGVTLVAQGTVALKEIEPLIKLPARAKDTWTIGLNQPDVWTATWKRTFTMGQEEEVEVPAGRFTALVVDCVTQWGGCTGGVDTSKSWYVPGIGVVKTETSFGGVTIKTVLKSFTPGKG